MPNEKGKPIPADLPAGHKRDELERHIADNLDREREEDLREVGQERIDPAKFKHIDNEIAKPFMEQKQREREAGLNALGLAVADDMNRAGVTNPVPGYYYKWLSNEDFYRTSEARAAIRGMLEAARKAHFFPVTDTHDPNVASEFKSDGSLRRWGDVVLWAIHIDDYKALEARTRAAQKRMGAVEENYVNTGQAMLRGRGTAYDQNSPRMRQFMGAEKMQPFTAKVVPEDERR